MSAPHFVYPSSTGYFSYFHLLAVMNNAAVNTDNISICVSPYFHFFWVYTLEWK